MAQKKMRIPYLLAVIVLIVAVCAAGYATVQRYQLEHEHQQSLILLDYYQVQALAAKENLSVSETLQQFEGIAKGVLVKEPLMEELVALGIMAMRTAEDMRWELQTQASPLAENVREGYTYFIFDAEADANHVLTQLQAKNPAADSYHFGEVGGQYVVCTSVAQVDMLLMGFGFPESMLQPIADAGMGLAVQIRNWNNFNTSGVDAVMENLRNYEMLGIGFNDDELPGVYLSSSEFAAACQYWMDWILELDSSFFPVEFFDQLGMGTMLSVAGQDVLRLHTIPEKELKAMNSTRAISRYQLAASERNVKLLFVRFMPQSNLEESVAFIGQVNDSLLEKGISQENFQGPMKMNPNPLVLFLCAAGVVAGAWILARRFRFNLFWATLCAALALALAGGLLLTGRTLLMQKLFALFSVLVFPTLSIILFTPRKKQNVLQAIGRLLLVTVGSLVGALLMVGLLADGTFMLKTNNFTGVKIAHLLPVLLLAAWFFLFREKQDPLLKTKKLFNAAVTYKWVAAFVVIAGLLLIYLLRTGNDTTTVSEYERLFRAMLDNVLFVRPRTKEFLFGHPLLLLAFYWGYQRDEMLPVLALGAIGQISLVNTFAHIHTPVLTSLLRTINGLVLGIVIGVALILVVNLVIRLGRPLWRMYREKEVESES